MPVTAKLSKRFYEVLGEDVANELVEWFNAVDATYRSDLRELNELNFARFDAKLEQRVAEVRAEFRHEIAGLRTEMKEGFARADAKIEYMGAALQSSIQKSKVEILQWMFGTAAVLLGALVAVIRL